MAGRSTACPSPLSISPVKGERCQFISIAFRERRLPPTPQGNGWGGMGVIVGQINIRRSRPHLQYPLPKMHIQIPDFEGKQA